MWVQSLGQEDPLEEEMETHSIDLFLHFYTYAFYFSFFIALVRSSSTMLKGLVEKEILALIPVLWEKHSLFPIR